MGTMAKIDDSVKKKVPELRFKGFTNDWEERKLGELSNIVGGGTPSTSNPEYWDGDIDWYAPAEIGEQSYVSKSKKTITELGLKKSSARILPVGTVLFTSRAGIGNTAILAKEATTNQGFQSIVPDQNKLDSYFIFSRTNELKRYGEVTGAGSTFVEVSGKQMSKMSIMVPELSEQQKIGNFFKELDNTIALHQRKLDLLKEQKKGYLQKMFPKNGAKVPELRFAGFADDWEERKLKDVTERVRSNDGRMDLPTLTMSASSGWLDQKDRFSGDISGKEKKNYTLLKKGELSYNHGNSKLAKYGVVFSLTNYEEALVPRVYHSFKALENTSADFIEYMFSTKLPDRELGKLISSGARMDGLLNINYDDFMNIHISIPNYEEQILMSAFFRKLDENIALHQRKLDLLKEQKKGFLQKMFV